MNTHHCTCDECERRRQQAGDEAFADMAIIAHHHPDWFSFSEHHAHEHHASDVIAENHFDHTMSRMTSTPTTSTT